MSAGRDELGRYRRNRVPERDTAANLDLHTLPCSYRTSACVYRLFMGAEDVLRLSDYTDLHFVDCALYFDRPKMC